MAFSPIFFMHHAFHIQANILEVQVKALHIIQKRKESLKTVEGTSFFSLVKWVQI